MPRTVLTDGFKTLISIGSTYLEWKEIQPPGMVGGGGIDTTTHTNTAWRTMAPKALKTLSDSGGVCCYDPAHLDDILAQISVNQLITVTFPDNSTMAFWGWLDEFTPDALVEGEQPTASMKIIPSNQDADGDEVAPAFG
jgi:hypothetical protein